MTENYLIPQDGVKDEGSDYGLGVGLSDNFLSDEELDKMNDEKNICNYFKEIKDDEYMNNVNLLFKKIKLSIYQIYEKINILEICGKSYSEYSDNDYSLFEGF